MRSNFTSQQRTSARALGVIFFALGIVAVAVLCVGCGSMKSASAIVAQQTPGQSSGAGATFQGPANSAAPSTQIAQRRASYYPAPTRQWPLPTTGIKPAQDSASQTSVPVLRTDEPQTAMPPMPSPAWIDERTETTFGQHQDAAGLVQAATAMGSWGRARWFGILCVLFAAFALAWAHNNPEGYPLIAWKIGAVGMFLVVFDPSPWWLLLLIIPGVFYIVQKLKITLP